MNNEQTQILGAFDASMNTLVKIMRAEESTDRQRYAAYGAASFMLIVVSNTTDAKELKEKAKVLLNDVAKYLGFPETN